MTLRISPSRIKQFRQCPRQWAMPLFARALTTPGMGQGLKLDAAIEQRDPAPADPLVAAQAAALAPYIPATAARQVSMEAALAPGLVLQGRLDLYDPEPATVLDVKTTAGTKREAQANGWVLNEETIFDDPQAICYAWLVMQARRDLVGVFARWLYVTRRMPKPEAWPVGVYISRAQADAWIARVALPVARTMQAWKGEPPVAAEHVPHNPEACGYGSSRRCSFAYACPLLKGPIVANGMELCKPAAE
jgi:hypothetical protein